MHHDLYLGTSGFSYREWKGLFYPPALPQREWLRYYAEHYNALELNASFYRNFPTSTFQGWHDRTAPGFRFVLKGSREVTHRKQLQQVGEDVDRFFQAASPLGEKLAAVLWQFPARFTWTEARAAQLGAFLGLVPKSPQQLIELRHASWFKAAVFALLEEHGAGWVVNDTASFDTAEQVTGGLFYLRLHGPDKLYDSHYTQAQLAGWAALIRQQRVERPCYVFFNNTMHGRAHQDIALLRELLE